jgi:uncharacterized protein (DUF1330 family)
MKGVRWPRILSAASYIADSITNGMRTSRETRGSQEGTMAAYLIAGINSISDQSTFDEYRGRVGATMEPYGAKFLAGAPAAHVEGTWQPTVGMVIEFPSMDALQQWYNSDPYRELRRLRQRSADVDLIFLDSL